MELIEYLKKRYRKIMRELMINFILMILYPIFPLIRKKKRKILIISVFEKGASNSLEIKKVFEKNGWEVEIIDPSSQKIISLIRKIMEVYYVLHIHLYLKIKMPGQTWIGIGHGNVPVKGVGNQRKTFSLRKKYLSFLMNNMDYHNADSFLVALLLSISYNFDMKRFVFLGEPSLDQLLKTKKRIVDLFIKKKYKKYIIYLPTWRERNPDLPVKLIKKIQKNRKIKKYLKKNSVCLIFKLHPKTEKDLNLNTIKTRAPFYYITDKMLSKQDTNLYELLSTIDVLIGDYSSITMQWWLKKKPLIYFTPDVKEYEKIEGFALKPFEKWNPGFRALDENELSYLLKKVMKNDPYIKEREVLKKILFKHYDGKNTERLFKFIEKLNRSRG